jgi:hypothetical protein
MYHNSAITASMNARQNRITQKQTYPAVRRARPAVPALLIVAVPHRLVLGHEHVYFIQHDDSAVAPPAAAGTSANTKQLHQRVTSPAGSSSTTAAATEHVRCCACVSMIFM